MLVAAIDATKSQADFNPVALTPGSFTADVIVEKTAPKSINDFTTATMDNVGTNNTANTWFENGYFTNAPWTGVPVAGSTFVAVSDANRQYKMPPNYAANNAVFIANHPGAGLTTGTLTLPAPAAFSTISVMGAAGNGPVVVNYIVHHSGGADEAGSISVPDWTSGGSTFACLPNGRINVDSGAITSLSYTNGNSVRVHYMDIVLSDTVNPVTGVDFTYASGGRAGLFGLSGSTDNVTYTPVTVTGFTRDLIVEATAPKSGHNGGATVTMENPASGVANAGNGWYEQGFNRSNLASGVPTNGTSFTSGTRTYTMAPDYTTNNVFFISANPGTTTATITLNTPASFTGLSFLSSAGNGPMSVNVTVHYASDPDETFTISVLDWFNAAAATYTANGRYVKESLTFNNVGGGSVKIFNNDIALVGTSAVTSIDLSYVSGTGRAMIFALSGSTGGNHTPIGVSGYNQDAIVERTMPALPLPLASATTVSMDGGTNNTANTWFERGYYSFFTNSGFPAAGSTIDSLAQPDHHYQMPASYTANNAVYVDAANPTANLTIASPATYSALSFLSATANGTVTNQAIMQYADGTSETNTFNSVDWFGNTPYAFVANGRVNLNNRTINSDPGRNAAPYNPRLYEAQFALGNTGSPVTNIILNFVGAANPTTARLVVFAVSATAGAVPPIISSVSVTPNATYDGSNVVFNAVITGGTTPITYQWQKGTNGVYVNVSNGGTISGATTTNMVIAGAVPNDAAEYRLVASNVVGPVNSGIVTLTRVISTLPDVTTPSDLVTIQNGTTPGAEGVSHVIDNDTAKYLNFDADATVPFVGPVGFVVKPAIGNTIVSALRFYTANDAANRDPANYLLEGSVDGSSFTTISSASLSLPGGRNASPAALAPLTHNLQEVRFSNTAGYSYYRLSFNNVKNDAGESGMQIGEVEFLGVLNPNPPPTFTISPTDVSANEGTTATFTSLATGPGPITYQWYDVTGGDPGTLLSGETNPNLALSSVTPGQSGNRYRVVATNPNGSVTNPSPVLPGALLTVNSGAITIVQDLPSEILFYAGRTVSLSVGVAGTAPTYQWQSNGVDLVNGGRVSGANSSMLTIANLQLSDEASYQLQSSNSFGGPVPSTAASLYVTAAPNFHTNGVGWAFTNLGGGGAFFSGPDVLSLTSANDQRRAAWFTTPMNISAFQASFLYQDVSIGGADGTAFVIQNSAQGTNAIGGGGGGMAYDGIAPSAAVKLNIFGSSSLAFTTGGAAGSFIPTSPVDLAGGDPIQVNVNYDGSTLGITLSNTVSAATFITNISSVNLASVVGTNVAYVGITAATGSTNANQQVSNFRFVPIPTINNASVGGNLLLTWPGTIGGYGVDVSPSLAPTSWSTLPGLIDQTNATMYKVIAPAGSNSFYRLSLPLP